MPGPEDEIAAIADGSRGHLRASHVDREQTVEVLKAAFVRGMLAKDEFDQRLSQAFASRTYAELAAVTADIPAFPPSRQPSGTPARTLAKAARRAGICILVAFALIGVVALINAEYLLPLAFFPGTAGVIAASGFLGYGAVDAWQERRSRGQLPPRPHRDGRGLEGGRPGSTGRDPAPPGARPDQTRVDLRSRQPGRDRRHPAGRGSRAPRGTRLIPGAV
jgi:uncharacterized membrane protein